MAGGCRVKMNLFAVRRDAGEIVTLMGEAKAIIHLEAGASPLLKGDV